VIFFQCVRSFPFLSSFMISIVSVMLPYECHIFNMWLEYPDLLLLFFMSLICSLYLFVLCTSLGSSCTSFGIRCFFFFVLFCLCIWFQYVLYGVFRFECNFYMCIFKELY
jgi:hypothetical protein